MALNAWKSMAQAGKVSSGKLALFLPVLLLLAGTGSNHKFKRGASAGSVSSSGGCDELFTECAASSVCTSCVFSFDEGSSCTEYPFDPTDSCDLLGVSYCCGAQASRLSCYTDGVTLNYWACALEMNGCSLADMPCVGGVSVTSGGSIVGDPEYISASESEVGDPEYIASDAQTDESGASGGPARRRGATTAGAAAAVAVAAALALA